MQKGPISDFIEEQFLHFNAGALTDAAKAYKSHIESGKKMMITLGGAMSTAEIGIGLAEMIRKDKVHIISCTGANLEEDIMNLVAQTYYKRIPNYRDLTPNDELELMQSGLNRVTDTCIPEEEAFRRIENSILNYWKEADKMSQVKFPHEYLYKILLNGDLEEYYEIDPANSWLLEAAHKNLPLVVPGWEDSTLGNIFTAHCISNEVSTSVVKSGIEYMIWLADWYQNGADGIGFFQIGGGISGDFPICVVPMLTQDLHRKSTPVWSYFCQISDSTTSYGSYSGAAPNEKITWGKLNVDTPKFMIESDATIVAPLIFAYVLGK